MEFRDVRSASRMRDLIERIATKVVDKKRPDLRIGYVNNFDSGRQLAWIKFPGEDELVKVRVALNMLPTRTVMANGQNEADIVRVAGKPGSYYVADFVRGVPQDPNNIPIVDVNFNNQKGINAADATSPQDVLNLRTADAKYATITALAGKEPTIPTGSSTQYIKGDKTLGTMNKAAVGLDQVDNTADSAKPVSTAQQNALNAKENSIAAGTSSQYFRGDKTWQTLNKSAVGLSNVDNTSDAAKPVSTAQQNALNLKANIASPTFTGTVGGITKSMVGLGNVDNTSDANKPISTATQNALNEKADLVGGVISDAQLPPLAILDTHVVASQAAMLALTAQKGDVAVRTDINKTFRLQNSPATTLGNWIEMPAAGAVTSVAGKTGTVSLVKGDVGLGNVDNTSDANKPVSTAQQNALNAKEDSIAAGTTGQYFRGDKSWQTLNKAAVGLSNVDNTSDAAKPVSTATQTALNLKQNASNAMTTDGAQVITGKKTLATPLAFDQLSAAPTPPPAGDNQIYFKSDGVPYYMGADGVERPFVVLESALHTNPSFETFTDGVHPDGWGSYWRDTVATPATWQRIAGQSNPGGGSYFFRITAPNGSSGSNGRFQSSVMGVMPGQLVTFSIWARSTSGTQPRFSFTLMTRATGTPDFFDPDNTQLQVNEYGLTSDWSKYTGSWIVPDGHYRARVDVNPYTFSGTQIVVDFDNSASRVQSTTQPAGVQTGSINLWPLGTAPAGYLLCNGAVYNIADYPTLGALLGSTFGGNGTSTFGVPDLRRRLPYGAGTSIAVGTNEGVAETSRSLAHSHDEGSLATSNSGSHTHNTTLDKTTEAKPTGSGGGQVLMQTTSVSTGTSGSAHSHDVTGTTGVQPLTGVNALPYFAINFIIKT